MDDNEGGDQNDQRESNITLNSIEKDLERELTLFTEGKLIMSQNPQRPKRHSEN